MLSGRQIHLHQALGLGPMWFSRNATVIETEYAENVDLGSQTPAVSPPNLQAAHIPPSTPTSTISKATAPIIAKPATPVVDEPAQAEAVQRQVSKRAANLLAIISQAQQGQIPSSKSIASTPVANSADHSTDTLHSLTQKIQTCQLCDLSQGRRQALAPVVQAACRLIVVVPQPSLQDDVNGHLLSGDVAPMWDKLIAAIGLKPEEVYVTSAIKCAPNLALSAKPHHVQQCRPYLQRELQLLPKVPVLLLAENQIRLWQRLQEWCGSERVFRIPHPSKMQRNPSTKRAAWETLQALQPQL